VIKALATACRELLGLFVEDGSLALALLAWVALAIAVVRWLPESEAWLAPLFAAGCLVILVENIFRAARR